MQRKGGVFILLGMFEGDREEGDRGEMSGHQGRGDQNFFAMVKD